MSAKQILTICGPVSDKTKAEYLHHNTMKAAALHCTKKIIARWNDEMQACEDVDRMKSMFEDLATALTGVESSDERFWIVMKTLDYSAQAVVLIS